MELYLIRHATAHALGERGITDDAERPLTEDGEKEARQIGAGLKRRDVRFDVLLTSPLLRARQTAERLLSAWKEAASDLRTCDELAPGFKCRKLAKALARLGAERVGLVGHQPSLGEWTGWLIGSKKAQLDIAKAGVAHVHCDSLPDKGSGNLVWLVPPEWLS